MKSAAAKTGKKQRGVPFKPGRSGNPNGRPAGSRNRATLAIEGLLEGEAETLARKAVELAKAGDLQALRLCLDRLSLLWQIFWIDRQNWIPESDFQ